MKKLNKQTIIILSVIIILLVIGIPLSVYGYNSHSYNKCYNEAVQLMKSDKFDEAVAKFYKALDYKKDDKAAKDKLELIKTLRSSKQNYEDASKLMGEKKYLEAMELYKKVPKDDENRFDTSQKRIEECKTSYIAMNLTSAKDLAKNNKYEEAIKIVDEVLALDKENAEAINLKNDYEANIQRLQAEAAAKAKADADAKAMADADALAKAKADAAAAATAAANNKAKTGTSNAITTSASDGKLVINDNGHTITFQFTEANTGIYQNLSYYVTGSTINNNDTIKIASYYQANYRIIFYDDTGAAMTANAVTRDPRDIYSANNILNFVCDPGIKFDVYITYKGNEYKFSGVTKR